MKFKKLFLAFIAMCGVLLIASCGEHVHTPKEAVKENEVASTCSKQGSYDLVIYCSECDEEVSRETKTLDLLAHTEVVDAAVAATCTTAGKTEGKHCSVCDTVIVAQEEVAALGHTWVEADCDSAKTCSVCNATEGSAKGHTAVKDEAVAPTCTEKGKTEGSHCSVCDEVIVAQKEVAALGHTWVEADCDTPKTCSVCEATEGEALGHTVVVDAAVAPTCTEKGKTEGSHCSVCNEVIVAQTEVPAKGHTSVDVNAVAPTCTEKGKTAGTSCSACGEILTDQEEIPATGHNMVQKHSSTEHWTECDNAGCDEATAKEEHKGGTATETERAVCEVCEQPYGAVLGHTTHTYDQKVTTEEYLATAATCEADATYYLSCECGVKGTETFTVPETATGHTPDEAVEENRTESTCEIAGSYDLVVYCEVCDKELSRETKALELAAHTEEVVAGKVATCTEDGLTDGKKCSVCGETTLEQETISATGHSYGEWTTKTDATCTEAEVEHRVCINGECGAEETRTGDVAALEHHMVDNNDDNQHWEECDREGCNHETTREEHNGGNATCKVKAVCGVCGESYGELAEHTPVDVEAVEPTCTEKGKTAGTSCSVCGEVLTGQEEVPATGHSYSEEWTYDDTHHWHKASCSHTEEISEKVVHTHDDSTGLCECGRDLVVTQVSTHNGTAEWSMTEAEKLAYNSISVHNVKVALDSEGNLPDFSLIIQHRGWENNGERTYFYTIESISGVLRLSNQLGIEPWSYTYFALEDEHITRLTSEEGLDFVVNFDEVNQKVNLYIYTDHELQLLHTLNTYYSSMTNFYKYKYVLTGEANIITTTYKVYDTTMDVVFTELGLALTEHDFVDVIAIAPTCEVDGVLAHKNCTICDKKYDNEDNELTSVVDPKTGHSYSNEWVNDNDNHWHKCLNGCELTEDKTAHTLEYKSTKTEATESVEGIEIWGCSVCTYTEEKNIGTLAHTHTYDEETWKHDANTHWNPATCEHTDQKGNEAAHTLEDVILVEAGCLTAGVKAHQKCSVCEVLFDLEGNEVTLEDLTISATGHSYSDEWTYDETQHWHKATCSHTEETTEKVAHNHDDSTGLCECGRDLVITQVSTHTGTAEWSMTETEKLAYNSISVHNVKVSLDSEGNLPDFSLTIQHRGWENNGERTYFYTIESISGTLRLSNQLGIDPWSYTYFALEDEHITRLTSEEGLDFVVNFDEVNQKMNLYVCTSDEVVLAHSLDTYYGSMANFYKYKYSLTKGTATVTTDTYKIFDSTMEDVFEELGLTTA